MNKEIVCTTEEEAQAETAKLQDQGFNMIAPNFSDLKEPNQSLELPIKAKIILSGSTNERGWQICLLDFGKGRASVEKPTDYPIGSVCKITYLGLVERKGKKVKDFSIEVLKGNSTSKKGK